MIPQRLFFIILAAFLAYAGGNAWAVKKRELVDPPPPMAQPVRIQVFRGESVQIPLVAVGRAANNSQFLLRSLPQLGTLSEIQKRESGGSFIIYEHKKGTAPATDEFSFAAQCPGTPVSASAKVKIDILDRPSEFLAPESIEFGTVILGQEGTQLVTLSNPGGKVLQGTLKIDEGWELPEGKDFEIPARGQLQIRVNFFPKEDREYLGAIHFSHDPKAVIRLQGRGVEPVLVYPSKIELYHEKGKDSASIHVQNQTKEALEIAVSADAKISIPSSIEVPAGATVSLPVAVVKGGIDGFKGTIYLKQLYGESEVAFQVFPVPAKFEIEPSKVLDFGAMKEREVKELVIKVRNIGGVPSALSMTVPPPANVEGPHDLTIVPGEEKQIMVQMVPLQGGKIERRIVLRFGLEVHEIVARASVEGAVMASIPKNQGLTNVPSSPLMDKDVVKRGAQEEVAGGLSLENLTALSQTENSVVLEWKTESKGRGEFRLERRILGISQQDTPITAWVPMANAQLTLLDEGKMRAHFFNMGAGTRGVVRLAKIGSSGEVLAASPAFIIQSKDGAPRTEIPWSWFIFPVIAGLAIWILRKIKQRQREENAELQRKLDNNFR